MEAGPLKRIGQNITYSILHYAQMMYISVANSCSSKCICLVDASIVLYSVFSVFLFPYSRDIANVEIIQYA